jgi:hypothetical protein
MFGMSGKPAPKPAEKKTEPAKKQALVSVSIKLTPQQRDKLDLLGGDAWLREQIDAAKFESVFSS